MEVAASFGLDKNCLECWLPRIDEAPFDSIRKRMTTVHRVNETSKPATPASEVLAPVLRIQCERGNRNNLGLMKGAVDAVIDSCHSVLTADGIVKLDETRRQDIQDVDDRLAAEGHRVLGFAFRWLDAADGDTEPDSDHRRLERDFVFLGLAGMQDPLRAESKDAVNRCRSAGIRPIMITGDHPKTAQFIARELGIAGEVAPVAGHALERLSESELAEIVEKTSVYARVSPEHKLRIVKALQSKGQIVAMTGDGVNDAPALKEADIGVAMGITGTDVSKEAAETVLLNDNFSTIVNSVEEGRTIYDNIGKFLKYTLTSNPVKS